MNIVSTKYDVFDTTTGLHHRVDSWEEAIKKREEVAFNLIDRIYHTFQITKVDESEDGSVTMTAVNVDDMKFVVTTVNVVNNPALKLTENP